MGFDQTEVESNEAEAKTQNGALSSKEREPSPKMEEESLVAREGACQDEEVHRQEKAKAKSKLNAVKRAKRWAAKKMKNKLKRFEKKVLKKEKKKMKKVKKMAKKGAKKMAKKK